MTPRQRLSVIIPAYRRPGELARCLEGVRKLSPAPAEAIVVRRASDDTLGEVLRRCSDVHTVVTNQPGTVAALAAGIAASSGSIIATIDDDAVPRRDWVARLLEPYGDARVGGVGGRDSLHGPFQLQAHLETVGVLTASLRSVGGHHIGIGPARPVDILKGVNFSARRDLIRLPAGLRGEGAQVGHEMATSLEIRRKGYALVYDPAIVVDHYPAPRFDYDLRDARSSKAIFDSSFNLTYIVNSLVPALALPSTAHALLIGNRARIGLARAIAAAGAKDWQLCSAMWPSMLGVWAGAFASLRHPLGMVTPEEMATMGSLRPILAP
ncbi:MAG: glycosyltransferase [Mycobacteriales bacterium]